VYYIVCSSVQVKYITVYRSFCVLGFANCLILRCLSSFLIGAGLSKRTQKNRLVHISSDLVIAVKENTAVHALQTELRFLYWKFVVARSLSINALFHHLPRITYTNVSSLLCSIIQEESSPNKRTNFRSQNEKNF
jgi:hypothetical protein